MSTEQAQQFIQRLMSDTDFRERLESAPPEQQREIIVSEGFGDVRLRHLSQALPESAGGELTDEEFATVAGGYLGLDQLPATAQITGMITLL